MLWLEWLQLDRGHGNRHDLEEFAHIAIAGTRQTMHGLDDFGLCFLVLVAAQRGGPLLDTEPDQEVALVHAAIEMDAGRKGCACQVFEVHMARQVGMARMGEWRVIFMRPHGL
ncbi:hypothetical protein VF08_38025 [Nostoc linckia z8]|uniref:Uncharacterized protein n=1 Tax=Nostoc linckia z8 TaxID=1628746 RepID=A0A9Q5Z3Y8_NOSLI|nr:hypothetical protein VF08_38025 [Nostoc linckia z8]